jgi:hypothetical protein
MIYRFALGLALINLSCNSQDDSVVKGQPIGAYVTADVVKGEEAAPEAPPIVSLFNDKGTTITTRINAPSKFSRTSLGANTFGTYLRNLPLKKSNEQVKYYNGAVKSNDNVYCAVVDKPIGNKDLHQCADAVMYLWASYLFEQKKYADIKFKFLNNSKWHYYTSYTKTPSSETVFFKYIQEVWTAANTRSLNTQVNKVNYNNLQVGDFLLQVGNPYGHAILIVDECIDEKSGKKLYLLAQSYMPAQETQVLLNPANSDGNPWYNLSTNQIITPEWQFTNQDFKRF